MLDQKAFGQQVINARLDRRLTHEFIAKQCIITSKYLKQIEQGTRIPSLPLFIDMCNVLHASPTFLLHDSLTERGPDAYKRLNEMMQRATPRQAAIIISILEKVEEYLPG